MNKYWSIWYFEILKMLYLYLDYNINVHKLCRILICISDHKWNSIEKGNLLCTALLLNEIYLPIKVQVSSLITFWVMVRTNFKHQNEQRTITPKVLSFELWFLYTSLLLNKIYLPMKFHVEALHSFKVRERKPCGCRPPQVFP